MKFCEICNNLLEPSFANDKMVLRCISCSLSYDPTNEDTLRKQRIKESDVMIYDALLKKAADDPVNEKVFIKCRGVTCSGTIAKMVRIGTDDRLYNVCMECKTPWLNT
jgi:DNA-directed RNA polymerase subunit M/transcription elongation factor TFIIS